MIADLMIQDDETATAVGVRYDVPKVLDAMVAFLEGFVDEVATPDARPLVRFLGDGGAIAPFDGDAVARFRRETLALARRWNVARLGMRVDVGPYALRCDPLGRDDLQRIGAAEPTLIDESPWHGLDPTPIIVFTPSSGANPLFADGATQAVQKLIIRHRPEGTRPDFVGVPSLRFPPGTFGLGPGVLRISLLTVPVTP